MENYDLKITSKIAAITVLVGSTCMIAGAVLMGISGADLDTALDRNELANYLTVAGDNKSLLIANLTIWIIGVIITGLAATLMVNLGEPQKVLSRIVTYNYSIAIPIVVVAYSAWMVIVVRLTSHNPQESVVLAEIMGWFASRADWIATILVLGIGPFLISLSGKNYWVPKWLLVWSYFTLFAGFLNLVAMFAGGLTTYGFLIIPVGMGWMIASFFVLTKFSRRQTT